jgi:purine-binding chemotaxis protein CheW
MSASLRSILRKAALLRVRISIYAGILGFLDYGFARDRREMLGSDPGMASEVVEDVGGIVLNQSLAATDGGDKSAATLWLLCRAGSHCFALPMSHVIEIMRTLPIEPLANAPPLVRGICVIRGAPVPVVETALLFDDQPARCERLVTVRTGGRTIAFAAESVLGSQAFQTHELGQLPPLLRNVEAIAGIKALDEELIFFLHTARIIPDNFSGLGNAEGAAA